MQVLVRAAIGVVGAFGLAVVGVVSLVLLDGDAQATGSSGTLTSVPEEFRPWIMRASHACEHAELAPALLAAQLQQESGFSTSSSLVSPAGAQGPAQFMPATWDTWGRDDDGNGTVSPYDVGDAVMAQGRMMCSLIGQAKKSGLSADIRSLALAGYNAGWGAVEDAGGIPPYPETQHYVATILASMKRFEGTPTEVSGSGTGVDAVRRASSQLGTPYSWGGGSPNGPTTGFCDGINGYLNGRCSASTTVGWDCSSLVQYAYWPNIHLPRTAADQYRATSDRTVSRDRLKVGDLLYWSHGGTSGIYHVAIYAGDGTVLHAPRTGKNVQTIPLSTAMPDGDYYGATRP
ncbi:NlpC/P60 family protein [Streptomyces sp. NPDC094437]|uniref:C40 family peptidase n=1 Tax=Streptomyces sp. NPDC094437 TaxID=3366060 RepID=UPI00382607FD